MHFEPKPQTDKAPPTIETKKNLLCFSVLFSQFHSRAMQLSILAVWDKKVQSLD